MQPSQNNFIIQDLPTDQFEDRPEGVEIDTIIIHSMHNPECDDRFSAQSCKACLDKYGVSSHYIIDIEGVVWRTVPEEKKAWHAGASKMPDESDGREGVNAFSIGIELVGTEDTDFSEEQYKALSCLTRDIMRRHSIRNVLGHADVAPGRKTDPWGLDWMRVRRDTEGFCSKGQVTFCRDAY